MDTVMRNFVITPSDVEDHLAPVTTAQPHKLYHENADRFFHIEPLPMSAKLCARRLVKQGEPHADD